MTVLGIELRSPSTADFLVSLLAAGLVIALLVILTSFGIFEPMYAAMLSASSVGGALANAYGASIKKSGWKGAVILCTIDCSALRSRSFPKRRAK